MSINRTCSIDACEDVQCRTHFTRKPHRKRWTVDPDTGCWIWNLTIDSLGYGRVSSSHPGASGCAYRWTYISYRGPIPVGLVLDHLCRNRVCVNPFHLEAVTQYENVHRSPFALAALNRLKTLCKNGHPFDGHNGLQRTCSVCRKRRNEERYRDRKGAAA